MNLKQKRLDKSVKKAAKLCDEANVAVENIQLRKSLAYQNWYGLKMDLEKLKFLLDRLTEELVRMRENRTQT